MTKQIPKFSVRLYNDKLIVILKSEFQPGSPSVNIGPELNIQEAIWFPSNTKISDCELTDICNSEKNYNLILEIAEKIYFDNLYKIMTKDENES